MFFIDNLTLKQTRAGKPLLTFNIALGADNDLPVFITGCYILDGMIYPPSFRAGNRYCGSAYLFQKLAEKLWEELHVYAEEFPSVFPLLPVAYAIDPIKMSMQNWVRLYPRQAELLKQREAGLNT